jgi:hypothetical protein
LESGRSLQKLSTSTAIRTQRRPRFLSIQSRKFSATPAAFKEKYVTHLCCPHLQGILHIATVSWSRLLVQELGALQVTTGQLLHPSLQGAYNICGDGRHAEGSRGGSWAKHTGRGP